MSDSEDSEDSEYSDSNDMDDIDIKYFNHIDELKKIKIKNHCFLKKALIKYRMQTDTDSQRENILMKIIVKEAQMNTNITIEIGGYGNISNIVKRYLT